MAPIIDLVYVCPKGCGRDKYGVMYVKATKVLHIFKKSRKDRCWQKLVSTRQLQSLRTGGGKLVKTSDVVLFIDPTKQKHAALVTNVFEEGHIPTGNGDDRNVKPAINLVYVDPDPAKHDPYGRQIARATSIVHIDDNTAKANCWKETYT